MAAILDETAMDPSALVLELTEGIFIDDVDRAGTVLADLKSIGVQLALDDFGAGYSSLSHLRQLPVDIVKIDQGFFADIGPEATGTQIIGAVTDLAHVLGLSVTAEGIETDPQREEIAMVGCDNAQGFMYARPMPEHELAGLLTAHQGRLVQLPYEATDRAAPELAPQVTQAPN